MKSSVIVSTTLFSQIFWNMQILHLFKKRVQGVYRKLTPSIIPVISEKFKKMLGKQITLFMDEFQKGI